MWTYLFMGHYSAHYTIIEWDRTEEPVVQKLAKEEAEELTKVGTIFQGKASRVSELHVSW